MNTETTVAPASAFNAHETQAGDAAALPSPRLALDESLACIQSIHQKIHALSPDSAGALNESEQEFLTELLEGESKRLQDEWLHDRIQLAVSLLFPTWRGGRIEKPQHPLWHEKSWWWNGASLEELEALDGGDFIARVSSYVGCGETDEIHDLLIKREWVDSRDIETSVRAFCLQELARKEAHAAATQLAKAKEDLQRAQARLDQLNPPQ